MWVDIFLASLWGGFVSLDTTALMQVMLSRPLVSCSIIGLILGNFPLGFLVGVVSELLYISELPVGAAKFAESNVGSTAAATIAILATEHLPTHPNMVIAAALTLTVVISSFGGRLVLLMRSINGRIYEKFAYKESLTTLDINLAHMFGLVMAFLLGFIVVFLSCVLFEDALVWLLRLVPEKYDPIFKPVIGSVLAVGCVFLVQHFWRQNSKKWFLLIGLVIGLILFFVLI
jgi:PTS system mannose-specific IIC component